MAEVTTGTFAETAREEADRAMKEAERRVTAARDAAGRRAGEARADVGKVVLDVTDEYFPEAAAERRRRDVAVGFAAGAVAGLGVGFAAAAAFRR